VTYSQCFTCGSRFTHAFCLLTLFAAVEIILSFHRNLIDILFA